MPKWVPARFPIVEPPNDASRVYEYWIPNLCIRIRPVPSLNINVKGAVPVRISLRFKNLVLTYLLEVYICMNHSWMYFLHLVPSYMGIFVHHQPWEKTDIHTWRHYAFLNDHEDQYIGQWTCHVLFSVPLIEYAKLVEMHLAMLFYNVDLSHVQPMNSDSFQLKFL